MDDCQLQRIIQANKAQGVRACKGRIAYKSGSGARWYIRPCNSKSCFLCHIYGEKMVNRASGMIWRAIGNLFAAGMRLYFITITPMSIQGDYTDDWNQLLLAWDHILRSARNHHKNFEYVRLASQGVINPHLHIIATVPIEAQNGQKFGLDVHCREIAHTPEDIAKVARYMRRNMRHIPYHISTPMTTSRKFQLWSNPALWRVVERFPVDVYTAQRSILHFKKCSLCQQLFPESHIWFQKSGGERFRSLCKLCQRFEDCALSANKRARAAGISGSITRDDMIQLFENSRRGDMYLCAHTGVLIPAHECSVDHIKPLCDGGSNTLDNLCITSKRMNAIKGSTPLTRWLWRQAAIGFRPGYMPSDMPVQARLWEL